MFVDKVCVIILSSPYRLEMALKFPMGVSLNSPFPASESVLQKFDVGYYLKTQYL